MADIEADFLDFIEQASEAIWRTAHSGTLVELEALATRVEMAAADLRATLWEIDGIGAKTFDGWAGIDAPVKSRRFPSQRTLED